MGKFRFLVVITVLGWSVGVGTSEAQIQPTGFAPRVMSYLEGTPFTITGTGLSGPGLTVWINGVAATVTSVSPTSIEGVAPRQLSEVSGTVAVTIEHLFGSPATLLEAVTLVAPFAVTSFTPIYFLADQPGQWLTLEGNAFTPITDVEVFHTGEYYDAVQLSFTNPSEIQVELPPAPLGTFPLSVRGAPGSLDVSVEFPDALTFIPEMSLTQIPSGPVSYLGTTIELAGEGFTPFTEVLIDGVGVDFTLVGSDQLLVEVPPRPTAVNGEEATLIVIDPVSGKDFFSLEYWASFTAESIDPVYVPANSLTVVTIAGTGFSDGTQVEVDELPADVEFVDHTTLEVTVPALPSGGYPVRVFDGIPGGIQVEEQFPAGLIYHEAGAPSVTSVEPSQACFEGGQLVTVHGVDFIPETVARINGLQLLRSIVSRDGTRISGRLAAGAPGAADVTVEDFRGVDTETGLFTLSSDCPTLAPPTQIEATLAYGTARFRWTNPELYDEIRVTNAAGVLVATLTGDATEFETPVGSGEVEYELS
ncbi:MAG: IPT/TIG domain-containing protein, partial [Planctomycetota bacterium]